MYKQADIGIIKCSYVPREIFENCKPYEKISTAQIRLEQILSKTIQLLPEEFETMTKKTKNGKKQRFIYANFDMWGEERSYKMIVTNNGWLMTSSQNGTIVVPKIMLIFGYSNTRKVKDCLRTYHHNFAYMTNKVHEPLIEERNEALAILTSKKETLQRFIEEKIEIFCTNEIKKININSKNAF